MEEVEREEEEEKKHVKCLCGFLTSLFEGRGPGVKPSPAGDSNPSHVSSSQSVLTDAHLIYIQEGLPPQPPKRPVRQSVSINTEEVGDPFK